MSQTRATPQGKSSKLEAGIRGGSLVFVGWRRAQRSPTDEHDHLNQSGIKMDCVEG